MGGFYKPPNCTVDCDLSIDRACNTNISDLIIIDISISIWLKMFLAHTRM